MTHEEARFILRSHRPGTADDRDPVFAEALVLAERDPALRSWWNGQRAFDEAVARKLSAIGPAHGSVEAILAAARAQQRSHGRHRKLIWLAAAAVTILLTLASTLPFRIGPITETSLHAFALADTSGNLWGHKGNAPELKGIEDRLASGNLRAQASQLLELSALRSDGCRVVSVAGREVFEFCFGPNHEFHLYVAKRGDFPDEGTGANPTIIVEGRFAVATWADERHVYSLVTYAGIEALRSLL